MKRDDSLMEFFLEKRMVSSDGDELRKVLDSMIAEEKQCLEQFKLQINICFKKIDEINEIVETIGPTHKMMTLKRAYEEYQFILNVAAQFQQCSFETKGLQKILYFEKNESSRERLVVDATEMMYEWCEDLQELTAKHFQDISKRLLTQGDLIKTRVARKRLGDFFNQEKPELSKVRHNVGAHREHDFMKEQEVLDGLGWSETIERLHRFEVVTLELGKTITPLMKSGLEQIGRLSGVD